MTDQTTDVADEEDDFGLPARLFDAVLDAVEAKDAVALDALLNPLHAADIADLLEQIDTRPDWLWSGLKGVRS